QREGSEHEKILFCYPPTISIGEQTNYVGLTEGYILCSKQFSPNQPCEAIHTQKTTIGIYSPENDIYMLLSLNNPAGPLGKDGKREYYEDEIDDLLVQKLLQQTYQTWLLFNGTMNSTILRTGNLGGYEYLRKRLDSFLKPYVKMMPLDQLDLFNALGGIKFLPIDKNIYLTIFNYVNSAEVSFQTTLSTFRFGVLLYKDNLILSSMDQNETRLLYNYLVNQVKVGQDSAYCLPLMASNVDNENQWYTKGTSRRTGFLNTPDNVSKRDLPIIYLENGTKPTYMIIYEQKDTISLFLIDPSELDQLLLKELSSCLVSNFEFINPALEDGYNKKTAFDEQYKYIYFNQMNLAIKASIKSKGAELTKETIKMLNEIHSDFEKKLSSEVTIRTQSDRWIVAKKVDYREFYVIFDNKNINILEVTEEVKNLTSKYFKIDHV
ncbi:hypothetical protein CYY_009458, partial [Polysphondylium violaceum]